MGSAGHEIEIPHLSTASSVAFPKELFRFCYTYCRPNKPISSVTLDFSEALSNLIEKDLLHYSTAIGGATFRHVAGVCLSLTFLTSLIVSAYWWNTRTYSAMGMLVCAGLGLLLLLFVPWHTYLAGFAMYRKLFAFFLIRHAAPIFFLSLVATLLGIPLSYFSSALAKAPSFSMKCLRAGKRISSNYYNVLDTESFARSSLGERTGGFFSVQCLLVIEDKPIRSLSQQGANQGEDAD